MFYLVGINFVWLNPYIGLKDLNSDLIRLITSFIEYLINFLVLFIYILIHLFTFLFCLFLVDIQFQFIDD